MIQVVTSEKVPAPIGPFSPAVQAGDFVFLSGQVALGPDCSVTGTVGEQTERVLEGVRAVLEAAGSSLDRVLKATVFLRDMGDFADMNAAYARFFPARPPARTTVEVSRLPRDARVEIEVIAWTGKE